ncbi:MAG: PilZ domain-containing protein [Desulfarculaceae bacterium]|nr:PilZ domain-containing protein [Desulfarculaceae bacterium]
MNTMNGSDRRRHKRVDFSTRIRVLLDADDRQIDLAGDSKDLSLKGIYILTDERVAEGTKCSLKIFLTGGVDDIELKMESTVARVDEKGLGVTFDSMDVDSFTHLKNIVKYNRPDA